MPIRDCDCELSTVLLVIHKADKLLHIMLYYISLPAWGKAL